MDKLVSMQVFVKAAEAGSFAAVADIMRMSPQMVARHVAALENHLGTALINRTTRRQHLTEIGRIYYERCQVILSELKEADTIAMEMKATPAGIIKVNAPVTFGSHAMAPFITRYLHLYPDAQVDLTLSDRIINPIEEDYEVIIRIGELADSSMVARQLSPYTLIACASPHYITKRGLPVVLSDLRHHSCLVYGLSSSSAPCKWVFEKDGRKEEIRPEGSFRSSDWSALMYAAIEGYGITLGPESVLKNEIKRGHLVRVLTDYSGPSRPMHALVPSAKKQTVKIRCFVEALRKTFPP